MSDINVSNDDDYSDEEIQQLRSAIKYLQAKDKQKVAELKELGGARKATTEIDSNTASVNGMPIVNADRLPLPRKPSRVEALLVDGELLYDFEVHKGFFSLQTFMKAGTGSLSIRNSSTNGNVRAELFTKGMENVAHAARSLQFDISGENIRVTAPNEKSEQPNHDASRRLFEKLAGGGNIIIDIVKETITQAFFNEIVDPTPKSEVAKLALQSSLLKAFPGPGEYLERFDGLLQIEDEVRRCDLKKAFERYVDITFNQDHTVAHIKQRFVPRDFISLSPGQEFKFSDWQAPEAPALICQLSEGQHLVWEKDGSLSLDVLSSKGFNSVQSDEKNRYPYLMTAVWNEEPTRRILAGMERLTDVCDAPDTAFPFRAIIEGQPPIISATDYEIDSITLEELSADNLFGVPIDESKRANLESAIGYHKKLKVIPFQGPPGTGKTLTQTAVIKWIFNTKSELGKDMQPVLATGPNQESLDLIQKTCKQYMPNQTTVAIHEIDFSPRSGSPDVTPGPLDSSSTSPSLNSGLATSSSASPAKPTGRVINIVRFPNSNVRKEHWLTLRGLAMQGDLVGIQNESNNFPAFSYLVARHLARKSPILQVRAACSNWVMMVGRPSNSPPLSEEEKKNFLTNEQIVDREAMRRIDLLIITPGMLDSHRFYDEFHPKAVMMDDNSLLPEWSALEVETKYPSAAIYMLFGDENQGSPYSAARLGQVRLSQFKRMMLIGWPCFRNIRQYRMHPRIRELVSKTFYNGELIDGPKCGNLSTDAYIAGWLQSTTAISSTDGKKLNGREDRCIFINTGTDHEKLLGQSYSNTANACAIHDLLHSFSQDTSLPKEVRFNVIAMYKGQIKDLRYRIFGQPSRIPHEFKPRITVSPLDLSLGGETDVAIIDFVMSNSSSNIGHLDNSSHLCVALSRARCLNIAVGDLKLLKGYKTPASLQKSDKAALESIMSFPGWRFMEMGSSQQQPTANAAQHVAATSSFPTAPIPPPGRVFNSRRGAMRGTMRRGGRI